MARLGVSSLRVRLLLLVLLAVVPVPVLMLYTNLEERRLQAARVQDDALRLARLASANQERLIEGARQLLVALARLPLVRGGDLGDCKAFFADLLRQYPLYANLGVIDRDGTSSCSALATSGATYAGDRPYFQHALETRDFAVGDYQIGRLTKKATINFGYPVLDEAGRVQAVVFSALDLGWLRQLAAQAQLPPGSMLALVDRNGTVLVHYPDDDGRIGQPMLEPPIARAIRDRRGDGTAESPGVDGVPRLFAFAALGRARQSPDAYVAVGLPAAVAFADADRRLVRNLTALGLVAILALAAAWFGGEVFVVRRIQALVGVTRRLRGGDLSARTGLPHGEGELGHLARAFDQMAESLERAQERRRFEEELRRRNYELEQQNRSIEEANRLKTEFVSMVSHELRTPLTCIQGYVELLQERERSLLTEEQHEYLTIVRTNADRLLGLINDLLDLARIEAGRIELHRTALNLARLIHVVADSLRPMIAAKRQRLTLDLGDPLPAVWADGDRVTQILTNLISNAHKYTPVDGHIAVAARRDDGVVRVDVGDSGIGLSREEQAQLFTKFFRARHRDTRQVAGTGLGLTITRLLVELHGGQIRVSSAPGQGSTFSFTLSESPAIPETAPTEMAAGPARANARVLVVDDEPDIANLIRRYLERGGLQVLLARDGAEALRVAQAERLDLIMLDLLLPDTDGFTVLERLKSDPRTAAIPVMLISVLPDEGHGKLLGAVDYVHKPLQEQALLERVGRILAGDRPRRVLVADGDAEGRALLTRRLHQAGYEVVEAADGAEAVALAREARPSLLLMDLRMPHVDGIAALRALRGDATTRDLPIIMMTTGPRGSAESGPAVEALGAARLLTRPCTAEELAAAIAHALSGSPR